MDALLKDLAEASLQATAAEDAVQTAAFHTARDHLDAAEVVLDRLRGQWPQLNRAERGIVGPAAQAVKGRVDAASRRIPRPTVVAQGPPVADPEQDEAPEPEPGQAA